MVDYVRIVTELKSENTLAFFAVVKMDELVDTWTVMFAADWVNDKNRMDVYNRINALIDANGKKADIVEVSRIGIFNSNHYLIKGLLRYTKGSELKDIKINGNTIHRGTVFYPHA